MLRRSVIAGAKLVPRSLKLSMNRVLARRQLPDPDRQMAAWLLKSTGGTALDIGANQGIYTLFFIGNADRVVAFEPIPVLAAALIKRYTAHGVTVECQGMSSSEGTLMLRIPLIDGHEIDNLATVAPANDFQTARERGALGDVRRTQIAVTTIDKYVEDHSIADLSLVKIDVEGHEFQVVMGGVKAIEEQQPILLVEIEKRHGADVARIFSALEALGYTAFFLERPAESLVPITVEEVGRYQPAEGLAKARHNPRRGTYINNFFFFPRRHRYLAVRPS